MRKQVLIKSVFLLLPMLALGLATTGDSVMVFDPAVGSTEYFSYFDQLPVAQFQLLLPLVGMLCAVVGILAVIYLITGKNRFLRVSCFTALVAAAMAVLPMVIAADVKVVPNVGVPIMMFVHYLLAYHWSGEGKKELQEEKGRRLKG